MIDSFENFEIYKDLYGKPCKRTVGGLFGSFHQKITGSNVISKKVVLLFRKEYSKRKSVLHFFKAIFDTSRSGLCGRFLVNGTHLYKW